MSVSKLDRVCTLFDQITTSGCSDDVSTPTVADGQMQSTDPDRLENTTGRLPPCAAVAGRHDAGRRSGIVWVWWRPLHGPAWWFDVLVVVLTVEVGPESGWEPSPGSPSVAALSADYFPETFPSGVRLGKSGG